MNRIGQALQVFALVLLPLSMMLELSGALGRSFGLNEMLIMLVLGVAVFFSGRIIEGYSARL